MLKLRKTAPTEPLVISMTAVRVGDRLLFVGCGEPKVIAQLAGKPGLSGRACAVDASAARTARAAAAAENAGALLEIETAPVTALPFAGETFDVAVVNHLLPELPADGRFTCLRETARVLRRGGRCVVVQAGRRSGIGALFAGSPPMTGGDVESLLAAAGFLAVRTIAERDGLLFVEGARRTAGA